MKPSTLISKIVLFLALLILFVFNSNADIHYACSDSTFYIDGYGNEFKHSLNEQNTNVLAHNDTLLLNIGVEVTLIPDTLDTGFIWQLYEFKDCNTEEYYNYDTMLVNREGIWCYGKGTTSGAYGFKLFVIIIDSSDLNFQLVKNDLVDAGYTLSVPRYFASYQWSTGDTINSIVINESGQYQITVRDYCNNEYSKEIEIDLKPDIPIGHFDSTTMVYKELNHVIQYTSYYEDTFSIDLNDDDIVDITFYIDINDLGHHHSHYYTVKSFDNVYICVKPSQHVKNIKNGDAINNKLHWISGKQLLVTGYINFEFYLANGCRCGWSYNYSPPKHMGIKYESGDKAYYGWLTMTYCVEGWITFESIVMEHGISGIEKEYSKETKIFPNPVTDYVKLNLDNDKHAVCILTIDGQVILTKNNLKREESVYVGHLQPGVYIVQVTDNDSKHSFKMIKN